MEQAGDLNQSAKNPEAAAAGELGVKASVGFASKTGPRRDNQDFAGALMGWELPEPRQEVIAAIADGIGGAKGGRIAAETAVRGFLDGFCDLPPTMEVQRAGARIVSSLNGWINAIGRQDANLTGLGCTLTALVLRGRVAHILHVGDTRCYRLSAGNRLTCLTADHVHDDGSGRSHTLLRALGVETEVRLDYASQPVALHDRFLLCSDGVHGFLADETIGDILRDRAAPEVTANALVDAALKAEGSDNTTALVLDVVALPAAGSVDVSAAIRQLPIAAVPVSGETVDGFVLKALISDGRYTRLFAAQDEIEGGEVVIKFPKPQIASVDAYRAAFVREAWVGARINNPSIGRVIELPPGRQTCLYTVMPFYQGELLETRLAHAPLLGLEEGRNIAIRLARAVAALHRAGIIHRDIKPDNVILEPGGTVKLIDLGVVRVPGLEEFPAENIPGTAAYMAPEMGDGEAGNETTDVFALGVTMFRAFTSEYPYGNAGAMSPARRARPQLFSELRPDLPAWVEAALARAIAADPAQRFNDTTEFAQEMETGPARAAPGLARPRTLYERAPVRVWQGISAILAVALALALWWHR
ncbi:MAG TPA: bifunctional protein-serine/threonine kinase/phosphatase [Stellaceae bacterium]|nr:bifunctional protein-serine/threonine kinase/phosphatase [Stellaceae bacterium]